jgi:putative modified peptide
MSDDVLPKEYALVLLRRLAEDDAFRAAYESSPAAALRQLGVPDKYISKLPPNYSKTKLGSKLIFQTALYQVIDNVATIYLCQVPPHLSLAIGDQGVPVKTSFESS